MSANSIKTAMKTVDSFLAHFTTPFGTMPTAQAIQGKDTVGAIIGLGADRNRYSADARQIRHMAGELRGVGSILACIR